MDRMPNGYKNLDNGLKFLPEINYIDRKVARDELE